MKKINFDFGTTTLIMENETLECAFVGSIKKGIMGFYGSLTVGDGKIICKADTQEELIANLDAMCSMKNRGKLHSVTGRQSKIFDTTYFFN